MIPQACPFFNIDMSQRGKLLCGARRGWSDDRCRTDLCPSEIGNRGEWRAVLADVVVWASVKAWTARHPDDWDDWLTDAILRELINAAGWST